MKQTPSASSTVPNSGRIRSYQGGELGQGNRRQLALEGLLAFGQAAGPGDQGPSGVEGQDREREG